MLLRLPYKETIMLSAWDRRLTSHVLMIKIKEVSHTFPHCVLDVQKCLLCNFSNLDERYIFKHTMVLNVLCGGSAVPSSISTGVSVKRRREYSDGVLHVVKVAFGFFLNTS